MSGVFALAMTHRGVTGHLLKQQRGVGGEFLDRGHTHAGAGLPLHLEGELDHITDRNILRIGAFEILYTETPDRVAINEAVELAKRYGARPSPQFVNGLLDRFLREVLGPG